jgi:Ser/Thr protein kinase RdoA (MazF antagonist)
MDSKIGAILDDLSDKQTDIVPSALRSFPYTYPEEDAQPIHGDLNYGNIIFDQTGEPVPIDFENCLHSWCTVGVDLAWVIERHILVHTQDDSLCLELCGVLLRNYLRFADSAPQELNLAALLTTKVLRPLLLLSGSPQVTPEIEKFHFLYREIQRREGLIESIDRLYRRMRAEADSL